MQEKQSLVVDRLTVSIEDLHRTFGAWNTARALLRAVRKQRRDANRISDLSDHMLRDMGLPERTETPLRGLPIILWTIRL
jgi:uncharacterized protein YjiS (DUF1127 family)